MAKAPRRWQRWMTSCEYERRKCELIVTEPRSGSTQSARCPNFLMKLVENLVDLEGSSDGFDENGHLDGAARKAERILGVLDDLRPEPRFEAIF